MSGTPRLTSVLDNFLTGDGDIDLEAVRALLLELKRIAAAQLRRERTNHTLQPTALVNEAYAKLVALKKEPWSNRAHFLGMAAHVMREVLVEHARKRAAQKRPPSGPARLSLSGLAAPQGAEMVDILALDEALRELEALDARQAAMIEQKYFAGLSLEELATLHNVGLSTVKRELQSAKLFLKHKLRPLN
jgi:RNA polymerase sigma-70 factor (ECF subfamily)